MGSNQITFKQCSRCKQTLPTTQFYKHKNTHDRLRSECKQCSKAEKKYSNCTVCRNYRRIEFKGMCKSCRLQWLKRNDLNEFNKRMEAQRQHSKKQYSKIDYRKLKTCSSYLGVHVAERVLSKVFKNVERMPLNYPGYDFVCSRGKKIDVKSACVRKGKNGWAFNTSKNTIADYFLCIAFDNRKDLNPLHLWLIPSNILSKSNKSSISPRTLHKWNLYKLDITKTLECCSNLKQ